MIRWSTLIFALLAAGSGLYMYQVKHRAEVIDKQIRHVQEATAALREHTALLKMQYTRLNDPQRLTELATAHLAGLKSIQPSQWTNMAELDRRLPPVGAATVPAAPLDQDSAPAWRGAPDSELPPPEKPSDSGAIIPTAVPPPAASPARAPISAAATAPVAAPVPALAKPAPRPAAVAAAPAKPAPTPLTLAAAAPQPRLPAPAAAPFVPARLQTPGYAVASVARPAPRADAYAPPPASAADVLARIAKAAPLSTSAPVVASALGMARNMAPPAPLSPASNATLYTVGTSQ